MSYIGNTSTTQSFTPAVDYFSGNASTTAFTLSRPVASVAQVQVTIDNVAQNPSSAYTISGSTITFTSAPLSGTNNIYVYYTSPITQVIAPGQGTVTATSMASSTGTGAGVFQTSPTLVTPALGTPSALVLTNATGLTSSGMVSGAALANIGTGNITPTYLASGAEIGPVFWGYRNSVQSGSGSAQKYTMNTAVIDTHSGFSSANSRWTVPTGEGGNYIITSSMYFRQQSGGTTNQGVSYIYLNGAQLTYAELDVYSSTDSWWGTVITHTRATALSAGDYVEQWFSCASNFAADNRSSGLWIQRVR
jgi:hypothetical protein